MAPLLPPPQPPDQSTAETSAPEPTAALGAPHAPHGEQHRPQQPQPASAQRLPGAKASLAGQADPAHQQRAVAALFLALLSLFGLLGLSNLQRGIYIVTFTVMVGVLAIWLAATAITRARRSGTAGPRGSVTALVIGGVGVLISTLLITGFALFGKQAAAYSRCLSGANTITAQQACQSQFSRVIQGASTR
ncbi:MAG TPA: hypothetical protein VMV92_25330 [Streptosporangiaceae bacterium]|nr:hypothetical protein [Streptosporangiaceae bacterium]